MASSDGSAAGSDVTLLLTAVRRGEPGSQDALLRLTYQELHRIATHYMRGERAEHTLAPTALVHEAWLRLVDGHDNTFEGRAHFFGVAAQAMRRVLVDHARRRQAAKRDGGERVTLDAAHDVAISERTELLALDEALERLAALDARHARVVELRFFAGLSIEEVAEVLGISPATVKRDWTFARAWLHRELRGTP